MLCSPTFNTLKDNVDGADHYNFNLGAAALPSGVTASPGKFAMQECDELTLTNSASTNGPLNARG